MLHRRLVLAGLLAVVLASPGPAPAVAGMRVGMPAAAPAGDAGGGGLPATAMRASSDRFETSAALLARVATFRFPAIDLVRPVYRWGCRGGTLPNLIVRWDCAGPGNTYLLGHAWGVFEPLHDARRDGTLRAGQHAYLTDLMGRTRRYELAWFRIVPQTYSWRGLSGDQWAWNATARPAVTLQTCWGATSAYRLIVRFYEDAD